MEIQEIVSRQAETWSRAHGWAPKEAADLLSEIRLQHYKSLSLNLDLIVLSPITSPEHEDGRLIIGWSHLGSMVECALQLVLGVHFLDFKKDAHRPTNKWKASKLLPPHELTLEHLRVFFDKAIWDEEEKKKWTPWILQVQQRRNAIHPLKPRPLGTWLEFEEALRVYSSFITELSYRLPEPD